MVYEVSAGEDLHVFCTVAEKDDALQTFVNWTYRGELINSENNPRLSVINSKSGNNTLVSQLKIRNITRQYDADTFCCFARTRLDEDKRCFEIRIINRPYACSCGTTSGVNRPEIQMVLGKSTAVEDQNGNSTSTPSQG